MEFKKEELKKLVNKISIEGSYCQGLPDKEEVIKTIDKMSNNLYFFNNISFGYLDNPILDELNESYCIFVENEGKKYICATDGVETTYLPFDDYIIFQDKKDNYYLIIGEKIFKYYFTEIEKERFDYEEFFETAKVDIDFNGEVIYIYNDDYETEFDFDFNALNDENKLAVKIANDYPCVIRRKVQKYIFENFDVDYSAYEYCTQNFTKGEFKVKNKTYKIRLDSTGNCFFGGFEFLI